MIEGYYVNMDGVNGSFKEGDKCTECKNGKLEYAKDHFPFLDYLICSHCDSTFLL
jgi:hypothetical protein